MPDDIDLARQCKNELSKQGGTPHIFVIGHKRWDRIVEVHKRLAPLFNINPDTPLTTLHGLPVEIDYMDAERLTCKA